jgi:hypothetical protein
MLHHAGRDELVTVGRHAGVVGDVLTIDCPEAGTGPGLAVRVVESHPVVIEGAVRHRLRLAPVVGADPIK